MKQLVQTDRIRSLPIRQTQARRNGRCASLVVVSALAVFCTLPLAAQMTRRMPARQPMQPMRPQTVQPSRQVYAPPASQQTQPQYRVAPEPNGGRQAPGQVYGQLPYAQPYGRNPGQPAPVVRVAPRAAMQQTSPAMDIPQRPVPPAVQASQPQNRQLIVPNRPNQSQQHLAGWMEAHRNLPLAQQQRALENEPGFRSYSPQEQQRMRDRLTQLNAMPPQQRQKVIERTEAMERLAPPQRQQVRNAMAQLGNLPEDRRHVVSRTFYQLRDLPPQQRQAYMNSPQFRGQFSDQERGAISGLLEITPLYPPLQGPAQPR